MVYKGKVYRPPSESQSLILQLTVGCPHNKCEFCSMYKGKDFSIKPWETIKMHIKNVRSSHRGPIKSIFLADGNSIIMKTEKLKRTLEYINDKFPEVERITSYGSACFVNLKSLAELKKLRQAGLTRIHTGMESGSKKVLQNINKGTTPREIIEAGKKVITAGIELSEYYLVGVGGKDLSSQHARESARVLNKINSDFIRLRTFMPIEGTELYEKYQQNEFELLSPHEALQETKIFLKNLSGINSQILSDHISNYWNIKGEMPQDKENMLSEVEKALEISEDNFRDPTRVRL